MTDEREIARQKAIAVLLRAKDAGRETLTDEEDAEFRGHMNKVGGILTLIFGDKQKDPSP